MGKTVVAVCYANYPFSWMQKTDENGAVLVSGGDGEGSDLGDYVIGYDVLMAKHICEELGYELEIYTYSADLIDTATFETDCVIYRTQLVSDASYLSEPYYFDSAVALVKSDGKYANAESVNDLKGATCVVTPYSRSNSDEMERFLSETCVQQIPDVDIMGDGEEQIVYATFYLDNGECDVIVTNKSTALNACISYPEGNYKILDFSGTSGDFEASDDDVDLGFYINEEDLKEEINSVLSKMTKEDFDQIMDEAISYYTE
ncbi:MAG: transporter substrate-binding domain-containing protein [Lachnospiraceae bacterium]|nr:transporter substrate-binding domain-containing protein [Lachnospiraceae bacterium]